VQDGEDVGVGVPYAITPGRGKRREYPGQLPTLTAVESLQEAPVVACRQGQFIVGKRTRPVSPDDPRRQVFVDDDHERDLSGSGEAWIVAAQQRIGGADGVESGLELVNQVSGREPPQKLSIGLRQAGIARVSTSAAVLEQFVSDGHPTIIPAIGLEVSVHGASRATESRTTVVFRRLPVPGHCHTEGP
jgi:hypothetical protein